MEKRDNRRVIRRLRVEFGAFDASQTFSGFTRDVSRTGAFITAGLLPPLGQRLRVKIQQPGGAAVLECEVVRHTVVPPQLRSVQRHGFGIRFLRGEWAPANDEVDLQRRFSSPADFRAVFESELKFGGLAVPSLTAKKLHDVVEVSLSFEWLKRTEKVSGTVVQCLPDGEGHRLMVVLADAGRVKQLATVASAAS